MGNGPPLTDIEKGQILAFDESSMSHREIVRRVNHSAKVVRNFLRGPAVYGTKYKPERARALDDRGRSRLFDEARKASSSARNLQSSLQLSAIIRTTQRELKQNDLFKYVKRNNTPTLTPAHRNKRVEWVKMILKRGLSGTTSSSPTIRSSTWTARMASRATGTIFVTRNNRSSVATVDVAW